MPKIGMGLVGPGFVGVHHVDAVRRLGNVDVVAVAASTDASARAAADRLTVERSYGDYRALIADPAVQVVHVTTPNFLHAPVIKATLAHGKHVVCDKPLAISGPEAADLLVAARAAGVVHAVTFNYRGNPMVQEARDLVTHGEIGPVHFVHGAYLQDWLTEASDFSWRLEPEKGGESSAMGDIGSHWCDLVEHVVGQRIDAVLAELTTVVSTRTKPAADTPTFPKGGGAPSGTPVRVRSEDLGTVLLRFDGGARGVFSIGQVCAGHKNDCWFEVNGQQASIRWAQESQNDLWIGRRHGFSEIRTKDPAVLGEHARRYAQLPGGHQQGWADAFCNVMRDIYARIAAGNSGHDACLPAFATFEDGYRSACLVDAVVASHRKGGVWTQVASGRFGGGR